MKRYRQTFLTFLILCGLLIGCTPKAETVYVTGEESEMITRAVDPLAENILTAIATNDYHMFLTDFDQAMRDAFTEDTFARIVKLYGKNGAHESLELLNIEDQGTYYGVNYGVNYAVVKLIMSVVVSKSDPALVSGLWFK